MTVRITESRIPAGYEPDDLGEAVEAPVLGGGTCALVGYLTSPFRLPDGAWQYEPQTRTLQSYVVFVSGASADDYIWTFEPPSGPPVTLTTLVGWWPRRYHETGVHQVTVQVRRSGAVVATLTLEQEVLPPDPVIEDRIRGRTKPPGGAASEQRGQWADTLRELYNDFRAYIQQAAAATGEIGVPTRLVTTILAQEGNGTAPKQGTYMAAIQEKAGVRRYVREYEADDLAEDYEANTARPEVLPDGTTGFGTVRGIPPLPLTIGPGNLGLWHIPSMDSLGSAGNAPLTPFREADTHGRFPSIERKLAVVSSIQDFRQLPYMTQVDCFNLARFPKSSIKLVARHLAQLKNRPNRWPGTRSEHVIEDKHLVEIVGSEYCHGPTTTPAASAKSNEYGDSTWLYGAKDPGALVDFDLFP